jgi:6-pyruvoyltetrahydropterin/6-carboxytetrahydropterin synthase
MIYQFYPQVAHTYKFELNKDMHFSAAHFIPAEAAGKCQQVHGHTYSVNLTIAGNELDECGFLVDFKVLKQLVFDKYDHTLLNDAVEFQTSFPTTEILAQTIHTSIQSFLSRRVNHPQCLQVIVRETPTSYVIYRP